MFATKADASSLRKPNVQCVDCAGFCGFQPKKKGMYVVDVIQDGAKFPGSPFQIQIGDTEVCSPSKVKVSGAVREGMSQQWNDVTINVTDAGQILVTV